MRPATVDAVIVENGRVVLVRRRREPFKGRWALPGGFVEEHESVEEAVEREALEETGLRIKIVKLLGVYSDPDRDPRRTVAVAFLAKPVSKKLRGGDDASEARWFKLSELPKLAFDHDRIIKDARRML